MFRTALVAVVALGIGACGHSGTGATPHASAVNLQAHAVPVAAVHRTARPHIADDVFAFGDRFEAVAYQLSFEAGTRDQDAAARACTAFVRSRDRVAGDFTTLHGATLRLAGNLMGTAQSAVDACGRSADAVDATLAENVQLDFATFREIAFDFAGLSAKA